MMRSKLQKVVSVMLSIALGLSLTIGMSPKVKAEEQSETEYSFNTFIKSASKPVVAGVDTMEGTVYKIEESNVIISDLNVDGEFCIWSGDMNIDDFGGYGKGNAKLFVNGSCYIKKLVIDCPVEIKCESGATLKVGELVVNTEEANGNLTYADDTIYDEATKTFSIKSGNPNTTPETKPADKTPEPIKTGDVVQDSKTGTKVKILNATKKEVAYKEPTNKKSKTVTIPASVQINGVTYKVTKVEDKAFKKNTTVTKITIPSSIAIIGAESFSGCKKLKTVSIPKNVTQIGKNAFKGCEALTKITIPSKCTKIGSNTFSGCKKMKTITINSTKLTSKSIASGAFKGLSKNVTIKVPKKQLKAYKKLLKKKSFKGKVKA